MSKKTDNTKKDILDKISADDVKMRSSLYFTILTASTILSAALLTLVTAIATRYLIDDFNQAREAELLRLSSEGRDLFVSGFPWGLLIVTGLSIWGTVWLYRKFDFSYKQNLRVFYGGLAGAVILLVVLLSGTGAGNVLDDHPVIERLQTLRSKVEDRSVRGTVIEVNEDTIVIREPNGETKAVNVKSAKVLGEIEVDKKIFAVGKDGEIFEAEVVRYDFGPKHKKPRILK